MTMTYSHKQMMLDAYRGIHSGHTPIAPEFWCYYPAKVLGVSMIELQREIPHWRALQATFKKYGSEGWGATEAYTSVPGAGKKTSFTNIGNGNYRLTETVIFNKTEFTSTNRFNIHEPSWIESYPVKSINDLPTYLQYIFAKDTEFDFKPALDGYRGVGEDFLLEYGLGLPFFDNIAFAVGFEKALIYFLEEDEKVLEAYYENFIELSRDHLRKSIDGTPFESYFIGCGYSCVSLIGPDLWRRWDKRYIKEMADMLHKNGKLLHVHFHGRCMEVLEDFAEIGIDCVCPFERDPGDVNGPEGLKAARRALGEAVAFNGNVHTVEALAKGTADIVRSQVKEIKEAFRGSDRLIIGTGDQVAGETPEENIYAMIEEGRIRL